MISKKVSALNFNKVAGLEREGSGSYQTTSAGGETVRAYIPAPLPPEPPLSLGLAGQDLLEKANRGLGRLDGLSLILPDTSLFLYMYIRKEAVLSSQIEGTQSSLSDLLVYESEHLPGVPVDDVEEVVNYVSAIELGLRRIRSDDFPISLRLMREIHGQLLSGGRGSHKNPGEFRRSQNWIGGTRPGNAVFVPPPPDRVIDCLGSLERFIHDEFGRTPTLIKAALAHLQFETIHPFLDGNGRLGRLLITLILCDEGALTEPLLYLSLYFKENRETYYGLLQEVRETGVWEKWVNFFLQGVIATARQAVQTAREILALFEADQKRIQQLGRAAGTAHQLHQVLQRKPIISISDAAKRSGVSSPTVARAFERLAELEMVREVTGKKRNRLYMYAPYLALVTEGT